MHDWLYLRTPTPSHSGRKPGKKDVAHRRVVFELAMARKDRIRRMAELRKQRAALLSTAPAPSTADKGGTESEAALVRLVRGDASFALVLRCLVQALAQQSHAPQTGAESHTGPTLLAGVQQWLAGQCGAVAFDRLVGQVRGRAAVQAVLAYEASGQVASLRSLNSRHLGDAGAALVAAFIERDEADSTTSTRARRSFLTTLGMACNRIGHEGARALGKALSSGSPRARAIHSVEVYSNLPGAFWGSFAGQVLGRNPALTNVDLGGNRIGDVGVRALVQGLMRGRRPVTSKTFLHLDYCGITDTGAALLHKASGGVGWGGKPINLC